MDNSLSLGSQISVLAIQIAVVIFAAKIFGKAAEKLKIPSVLGEIIAGVIIGPYFAGGIPIPLTPFERGLFPMVHNGVFPVSVLLYSFASFGSIVLLFVSGLETDIKQFLRYSTVGTATGLSGAVLSFALGALFGMTMFDVPLQDPRCLFLGILCTATSVGITAGILTEKKRIDSPEGTTVLAAAVLDDVIGIIGLSVVIGITAMESNGLMKDFSLLPVLKIALKSIFIWLGFTVFGIIFSEKTADFLKLFPPQASFTAAAFGLALLLAGIFEQAGLAMIVGAYVAGLSLSRSKTANDILHNMSGLYNFFVPVFFVVMGMLTDVRIFTDLRIILYGIIFSLLGCAAKLIGCGGAAYFMDFNLIGALRIGAGMMPRGEVALIIAGIASGTKIMLNGIETPVFTAELFGIAVIMVIFSAVVSPLLLNMLLDIRRSGLRDESGRTEKVCTDYSFPSENIRNFVFFSMLDRFHRAGFKHSLMLKNTGMTFFKDGRIAFVLERIEGRFLFKADKFYTAVIRDTMEQIFNELYHKVHELKSE